MVFKKPMGLQILAGGGHVRLGLGAHLEVSLEEGDLLHLRGVLQLLQNMNTLSPMNPTSPKNPFVCVYIYIITYKLVLQKPIIPVMNPIIPVLCRIPRGPLSPRPKRQTPLPMLCLRVPYPKYTMILESNNPVFIIEAPIPQNPSRNPFYRTLRQEPLNRTLTRHPKRNP